MARFVAAVFFDDDVHGQRQRPRVEPGRLVIDCSTGPAQVEFHSFLDQDAVISLPEGVFSQASLRLPANQKAVAAVKATPARDCHRYTIRLSDGKEAEGGSMPKMLVLP